MNFLKITVFTGIIVIFSVACESNNSRLSAEVNNSKGDKKNISLFTGKPASDVDMHYVVDKNIVAGEDATLQLTFINKKDVDDLIVHFKFDNGLESKEHLQSYNFGILPQEQESVINLTVSAALDGIYYIYVTATLVTDKKQSRSFAIPVNVGDVDVRKSLKTMGSIVTDPAGRRIISMPAQMK